MDVEAIAAELLEAADKAELVDPVTERWPGFDISDAYRVLGCITLRRREQGWTAVGRKIGFTNTTMWPVFGVEAPMWASVWDRTIQVAEGGRASVSIDGLVQARIESEVVLRMATTLDATDDPAEALQAVDAVAAGFEIVQCHYPAWRFQLPDATAAFGLHARLVVGEWLPVDDTMLERLSTFEAVLDRNGDEIARGTGANVLGSPARALAHLTQVIGSPIAAGEVITTGTLTDALPIQKGETWRCDYTSLGVEGFELTVT